MPPWERKSLADLSTSLTTGRLRYALAELAALPRAAVVVEDKYSRVFDLEHVRPSVVVDGLAECQARFPASRWFSPRRGRSPSSGPTGFSQSP